VLAWIAVPHKLMGSTIKVLLGNPNALAERRWRRLIQDSDPAAGRLGYLDPKQARRLILTARANGPGLAGREWIATDTVLALQLRRGHKMLNAIGAETVTELGVSELRCADPLLLLLHTPAHFQRHSDSPFEIVLRDSLIAIRLDQLQQSADRFGDGILIPP
jgi:hypothetical protein